MKVLVTGASGFLGLVVTEQLTRLGFEVYGLSTINRDANDNTFKINWLTADLFSQPGIKSVMKKNRFEGLVHLAWDTTHGKYWKSSDNLKWVAASLFLFESFKIYGGKRIIVAGSSAEYQWGRDSILDEITTIRNPSSLYGVSKNALRSILESWAVENNISWGWACIFNIFGPNEKKERLIPASIIKLMSHEMILFDNGLLYRDFMHVGDAGQAIAVFFKSNIEGVVNIASGKSTSVRSVLQIIANFLNATDLLHFEEFNKVSNEAETVVASVNRLTQEIGWEANFSMQHRLETTCQWWEKKILSEAHD